MCRSSAMHYLLLEYYGVLRTTFVKLHRIVDYDMRHAANLSIAVSRILLVSTGVLYIHTKYSNPFYSYY
jgi:hypothetical protein